MSTGPGKDQVSGPEIHAGISPETIKGPRIIAYNLREGERPGGPDGLKIRWKFRIETGRKAQAWDARQAEAIREALTWLRHHPPR
jgi:hypothetical protein